MDFDPADQALADAVQERIDGWATALPPLLGAEWQALVARLGGRLDRYFLHPLAHPLLQLPGWATGQPELDAAESAACGYLHVRIQDDLFDEGVGQAPGPLLLSDALRSRHLLLLTRAAGTPEVLDQAAVDWEAYGEAMLLERQLQDGAVPWSEARWRQVLDRSMPLALPVVAAARGRGRDGSAEAIRGLIRALVEAHQWLLDLVDVVKDTRHDNRTWLLHELDRQRGDQGRAAWLVAQGCDQVLARIDGLLARADDAGRGLGVVGLAPWIERRRALGHQVKRELVASYLRQLLSDTE